MKCLLHRRLLCHKQLEVFVPLITIKMNCTENQTKESDSRMNPSLIIGIGQHVSHDTQTKKKST